MADHLRKNNKEKTGRSGQPEIGDKGKVPESQKEYGGRDKRWEKKKKPVVPAKKVEQNVLHWLKGREKGPTFVRKKRGADNTWKGFWGNDTKTEKKKEEEGVRRTGRGERITKLPTKTKTA